MSALRRSLGKSRAIRSLYGHAFTLRYLREKFRQGEQSYAQDGEDLKLAKLLGTVKFFMDIGAHDGISVSNTFYFAMRGAAGLCFEPVGATFRRLHSLYLLNRAVRCLNCGISDHAHEAEMVCADFLSFLPESEDSAHTRANRSGFMETSSARVQLLTLADALKGLDVPAVIDVLSVDVEGHELQVLTSALRTSLKFRALVVETHLLEASRQRYAWRHRDADKIDDLLCSNGFKKHCETRGNSIYLFTP